MLIGTYKFNRAKAGYGPLAQLLDDTLPQLPNNVIIVPIPTVSSHIRERGYDHARLVAKAFAKRRKLPMIPVLGRTTYTKQREANRSTRIKQAKVAFSAAKPIDSSATYLLVDDVITTGATMKYAAKTLKDAGATTVWVAALSRQPLD